MTKVSTGFLKCTRKASDSILCSAGKLPKRDRLQNESLPHLFEVRGLDKMTSLVLPWSSVTLYMVNESQEKEGFNSTARLP